MRKIQKKKKFVHSLLPVSIVALVYGEDRRITSPTSQINLLAQDIRR